MGIAKVSRASQFVILVTLVMISGCQPEQNASNPKAESGWRAVYKHDENGQPIHGSIDSLIAGIRNGYNVRIGWGWERERGDSVIRLEHVASPLFVSVIQEKNVSAILDPHPLLASYIDIHNQKFSEGGHLWNCVLTTKGTFNAQVYNRSTGQLMQDWPQRHKMTWFLEYPDCGNPNREPLFN